MAQGGGQAHVAFWSESHPKQCSPSCRPTSAHHKIPGARLNRGWHPTDWPSGPAHISPVLSWWSHVCSILLLRPFPGRGCFSAKTQTMQVLTLYRAPAPSASMMVLKAPSMLRYFFGSTASRVRMVSSGNMASVDVSPAWTCYSGGYQMWWRYTWGDT